MGCWSMDEAMKDACGSARHMGVPAAAPTRPRHHAVHTSLYSTRVPSHAKHACRSLYLVGDLTARR